MQRGRGGYQGDQRGRGRGDFGGRGGYHGGNSMEGMTMDGMTMQEMVQNMSMMGMNPNTMMAGMQGGFGGQQNMGGGQQTRTCKFFAQSGNCKFGSNCNFSHDISDED